MLPLEIWVYWKSEIPISVMLIGFRYSGLRYSSIIQTEFIKAISGSLTCFHGRYTARNR